jgi:peptidoglycan hydrolase CwlO-like protein
MDAATASVVAAAVAAVGGIVGAYMNKVHKENRADHSYVVKRLGDLHTDVKDLKSDIGEVKVDIGILKSRHTDLQKQVDKIEENI